MKGPAPACLDCINYWGLEKDRPGLSCAAFPNGIPDEILIGENNHRKPYPGDNGIQFEPVEEGK